MFPWWLWLHPAVIIFTFSFSHSAQLHGDFCYINDFNSSKTEFFRMQAYAGMGDVTQTMFYQHADYGRPFVVRGVTKDWTASEKWTEEYFRTTFYNYELFSSTFATNSSPLLDDGSRGDVYYGIFVNDQELAEYLAADYSYPQFIPRNFIVSGNEWVHWGYPPCGAKRHMDLMSTSRVSVQIRGTKHWRFYPILSENELSHLSLSNWTKVLHPLEVVLREGEAVVWFPGWEHETRILEGLSVSLSLHFETDTNSLYVRTFRKNLADKVSLQFQVS